MRMLDALLVAPSSVAQMLQRRESQPRVAVSPFADLSADTALVYLRVAVARAFQDGALSLRGRGADDPGVFADALAACADDYSHVVAAAFTQAVRDCIPNRSEE